MAKSRKFYCNIFLVVIFILLILICATVIALLSIYYTNNSTSNQNDYAIVFDAGSSGTRMFVYYWQAGLSAARGDNIVVNQLLACNTNDNGIDKIQTKNDIILSFNDCMQQAEKNIPGSRKNRTYIILAATAGMRLLNEINSTQANTILNYIRSYFNASSFLFKDPSQVQIQTGTDEGLNAWISANYFLNKFSPQTNPSNTVGTLDLGGASTQIVFVPNSPDVSQTKYFGNVKIYGIQYNVYSYSYLCWGANQINLIYQTYLIMNNNFSQVTNGACFPTNYNITLSTSTILNSPCASGILFNFKNNFNSSYLSTNFQNSVFQIIGTSDPVKCASQMSVLFPYNKCSKANATCIFNDVYLPSTQNIFFYAFSSYYYQLNISNSFFNKNITTISDFINTTNSICSLNYNQLNTISQNNGISLRFSVNTCFVNNYILGLLSQYGITSFNNMSIVSDINGNSVGWTLGYLINQLNRNDFLPYEASVPNMQSSYFIPAIILLSICAGFSIISLLVFLFFLLN